MLGDTLAYSCGYWKGVSNLNEAQRAKFDLIARKIGLKEGMRVLDIGSGWGGLAKHLAEKYHVHVVALNLSKKQSDYARKLCKGLSVEIQNRDYRDVEGTFDRIVTVGFFEHVGDKNYRKFMEIMHRSLKDHGLMLLHTIGVNRAKDYSERWVDKYIFPNGQLPTIAQIASSAEDLFVMEDWHNLNTNYHKTLMAWYHNFEKNWDKIASSYPDPFYRMWKFYLNSFAAGFRARVMQLWQVVLSKKGDAEGYESIR
jgi:cyclopropane-fatty-acyl-phospholipid synthase